LRISSLAALVSAAFAPLLALLIFDQPYPVTALALFMAILIFVRHQENIRRLLKGEEPKIGVRKEAEAVGQ
jgi:glycerol-3-phosphate acyltransferase PlsY